MLISLKFKKVIFTSISILSLFGYGYFAFAVAPVGGYEPGVELDPDCAPGDTDCIVKTITADNGLTATGSNVQLGGTVTETTTIETGSNLFAIANDFSAGLDTTGFLISEFPGFPGVYHARIQGGSTTADAGVSIGIISYGTDVAGQMIYENQTTGLQAGVNIGSGFTQIAVQNGTGSYFSSFDTASASIGYQETGWDADQSDSILISNVGVTARGSDPSSGYNMIWAVYDPMSGNDVRENAFLYNNGNWQWHAYDSSRDDILSSTPVNLLYTDGGGNVLSAPLNSTAWLLSGNSGTTAGTNFIGTTDAIDFVIKVNGIEMGRFYEDTGVSTNSVALGGGTAPSSNMFVYGNGSGTGATNATLSVFIGDNAGNGATDAYQSFFIGPSAGRDALNANRSVFIGSEAGRSAENAEFSIFLGGAAGQSATYATYSNMFGYSAGYAAENASNSNFFGQFAGYNAFDAANSLFIGQNAGYNDLVNNTLDVNDYSILIGPYTSTGDDGLGVGFSNSIAMGAYATNTASNQFMIGSATRPIDEVVIVGNGASCAIDNNIYGDGTTGINCSSDERLKTNITELATVLDTLANIQAVNFNWKANPNANQQIGFIAQNLEQYYPELVRTGHDGYFQVNYAGMTPILVKAIQEMNLNITEIGVMEKSNSWRDSLIVWFGNAANGIKKLFVDEVHTGMICLGQTCVTEIQLQQLLEDTGTNGVTPQTTDESNDESENVVPETDPVVDDTSPESESDPEVSDTDTTDTVTETDTTEPEGDSSSPMVDAPVTVE